MESLVQTRSWESEAWAQLVKHADETKDLHLRDLLKDEKRCAALFVEAEGIAIDYSRQRVTAETLGLLANLAEAAKLQEKIQAMRSGEHINITEDRAVMHVALRAQADEVYTVDGKNVVPDVHAVLNRIRDFSDAVRSGAHVGSTGKPITQVVAIGIGGSYLGPEFVHEALRKDPESKASSAQRTLHFLANVDPVDVDRALEGFDPETTIAIVISKTFTTAETMMNAATVKAWLVNSITKVHPEVDPVTIAAQHIVAGSANVPGAEAFGIKPDNVFGFWDWVGGRYSVCSAVGVLPLALQYGFPVVRKFLDGANSLDRHFFSTPLLQNLPAVLGILGVWNSTFLGHSSRALLPYSQALVRFAAHIQQVDMESNGKRVAMDGSVVPFPTGEVNFGEPGTNGQHSFYQLIHQGTVIPCDFLGFCKSQNPIELEGQAVANHDELMSNFFAQPDALAVGRTLEEVLAQGTPAKIAEHKVFPGNRPSSSILFDGALDAYAVGKLLALYEHRTVVQGFIWGICSFDQWGVELGKVLAKQVRGTLSGARKQQTPVAGFNAATTRLLEKYISSSL